MTHEWRYTTHSKTKHWVPISGSLASICGITPRWFDIWLGARNDQDRARLKALPECKRCVALSSKPSEK